MNDNNKSKKAISRRDFFKKIGATGIATTGLAACVNQDKNAFYIRYRNSYRSDDLPYKSHDRR